MEGYQEFLNKIQKKGSKKHSIGHCLGSRDAWKWVRKNKWELLGGNTCSSTLYASVVNAMNEMLIEKLLEGHPIEFPYQMGVLQLVSYEPSLNTKDGKLTNTYPVDWKRTLECWYNDREMREKKMVVKRIQKRIIHIQYSKEKAKFKFRKYYNFRLNRSLTKLLGKRVANTKMNTLIC